MTTSNQVELVARAICENGAVAGLSWNNRSEHQRSCYRKDARAAIEALATIRDTDEDAENVVARLNSFVTCGCGDDEWPELRRDVVACIDRLASSTPARDTEKGSGE